MFHGKTWKLQTKLCCIPPRKRCNLTEKPPKIQNGRPMIHTPTKAHKSRWNALRGLFHSNFGILEGALQTHVTQILHTYLTKPVSSHKTCSSFGVFFNSIPEVSKVLKYVRGRYRDNMPCPSPNRPPTEIITSLNNGPVFCEILNILKAFKHLFENYKFPNKIQDGCLPVWNYFIKTIKTWNLRCMQQSH